MTRHKSKRTLKPATKSAGSNLFADLGLAHPQQEQLRARLTLQIYRLIRQRGLKQTEAGKILGIRQPHVSLLVRNRAGVFSVERLMEFLTALGQDVEITVRPTRKPHGQYPSSPKIVLTRPLSHAGHHHSTQFLILPITQLHRRRSNVLFQMRH
jgi:predicted XRE-type DNA-binding protein